jgi:hypothetical protein
MPYLEPSLYPEPSLYLTPTGSGSAPEPALDPWIPSPTLVARILRARIVLNGGVPLDDFTTATNPTRADVADVIAMHAPLVLMRTGALEDANMPCGTRDMLRSATATLIAQRAALEIEASYWPEEVGDAAALDARRAMLDADLTELVNSIDRCRTSDDDGGTGSESESRHDPAWRFGYSRPLRF